MSRFWLVGIACLRALLRPLLGFYLPRYLPGEKEGLVREGG